MQLRRQVGKQAKQRGANAVFGYQQFFDMEGDSGIVGRAYGTACMYSRFLFTKRIRPREKDAEPSSSLELVPRSDPLHGDEQPKRKESETTRRRREICEIQTRDIVCRRGEVLSPRHERPQLLQGTGRVGEDSLLHRSKRVYGLYNTVSDDRKNLSTSSELLYSFFSLLIQSLAERAVHRADDAAQAPRQLPLLHQRRRLLARGQVHREAPQHAGGHRDARQLVGESPRRGPRQHAAHRRRPRPRLPRDLLHPRRHLSPQRHRHRRQARHVALRSRADV